MSPELYMGQALGRALIVEDNVLLNCLLQEMVQTLGFSVSGVITSADAREAISRGDFDLMLTDLNLDQGSSGLMLAREAMLANRTLRVVIASGLPVPEELESNIGFLQKPFTVGQLRNAIQA
ncbi:MAG: response regulator [Rhizorhabdus sp.]